MRRNSDSTRYYIVDGQHRFLALQELGFPPNTQVRCVEHLSLTETRLVSLRLEELQVHPDAQKAVIPNVLKRIVSDFNIGALGVFHVVNPAIVDTSVSSLLFLKLGDRGSIGPYEKFKNRVQAKEPMAVGCQRIANGLGLKVQKTPASGAIICTDALLVAYKLDLRGEALRRALWTLLESWGSTKEAVTGRLVAGFARFFHEYPEADDSALAHKMAKNGMPSRFEGEIKNLAELTRESSSKACVQLLKQEYNRKRGNGRI